jgi:plastocyanin domain-containing protein
MYQKNNKTCPTMKFDSIRHRFWTIAAVTLIVIAIIAFNIYWLETNEKCRNSIEAKQGTNVFP